MDITTMLEEFSHLPVWAQVTLFIIAMFLNPTGIVAGAVAAYNMRQKVQIKKQAAEDKLRLEKELGELRLRTDTLEIERIKEKAEAEQAAAANLNMQRLIEVVGESNNRFQKVIDVKSERQLESDKLQHQTNKMFLDAVNRQTLVVSNLTEMLEIQSEQFGNVTKTIEGVDNNVRASLKEIEKLARDSRSDVTTALGLSVNHRTEADNTLRVIQQSIQGIAKEVRGIITTNEGLNRQALLAINAKLQSLETNVSTLITPRPALLGDTLPLPDAIPQDDKTSDSIDAATVAAEETKP